MADNAAQSIKDLQKDLAALDKQLLSNNANWDKLGQTIVDSLKRGGLGLDDLFSKMKSQKDVLKLRAIIDRDALKDDVKKLQTAVDKGVKSVKVGGVEITGQKQIEQALEGYKAQLKLVPKTLAEAYDYAVKIANTLGGGNSSKASKEWLERTALTTKEKKALDDATNGYIKQTQAIQDLNRTLDELKQKRATAEALPVTGVGKSGISYKTDASKQSALGKIDKEITNVETKINNATTAAQKFQAQLIAMQGEKKTKAMSRALGVEEAEAEVQKIPSVFDRVIAQINQRAAQSKDKFAKQLVNAEGLRNEAKNAAAEVSHELNYIWRGSQSHLLAAWRNNTGYLTDFGRQDAVNQIRLSQEYKSNLDALKTQEVRDKLTQALTRYKDALQAVITLEEQQRRSAAQYSAQERAVEGVTRRFNENEQAIARVRDRWDELNVKRQAGLVNEKDFKANSQKLLDEYDRLIAKRKEFETADIGQSLSERLRKQQEEEKRLEADRVRSAKETSKIITEERGKQALSSLIGSPKMNAAVQQQLKYMQQIRSIGKDINALQSNKNRSAEENALLEKRKKELRDVLELQKRLNNEQKGSANLARQIDKYNQLRGKVKETTDEVKRQKTSLESMLPTLQRLAGAFGVAFSIQGLVQFGKKLVETRGEFEMQFVAMKSIIGDVDAATRIWNQTLQQSLQSPKTFKELTKYTKQLAAYRIETDKLFETTKRLADVSAGLGVDMGRLILAYGQVKAANYLRASEVRQFTEAGVNIYGELARYFSEIEGRAVGTAEVVERVTKRMVLFSDVEKIFQRMTDEGGTFFNMQEIQADTVLGQINKLHDAYDQMLNTIGQSKQGAIRYLLDTLNDLVRNWQNVAFVLKGNVNWITIIGAALYALSRNYLKGATTQTLWFSKAIMGNSKALLKNTEDVRIFSRAIGDYTLKQRLAIVATRTLQGALSKLWSVAKAALPFLVFEGAVILIERLTRASRELKRFREELESVTSENVGKMNEEISGYDALVKKLQKTNEGTAARKEILDEISSKYGKYLDFIVTEKTTVEELAGAYDNVVSSIRNYTAEKIREEQQQRLEKGIYDEYQDLIDSMTGKRIADESGKQFKITKEQANNIAKVIQQSLDKYGVADIQSILETYFGNRLESTGAGGGNAGIGNIIREYIGEYKSLNQELQDIRNDIEGQTPVFSSDVEYEDYKKRVQAAKEELAEQAKRNEQINNLIKENNKEQWQADDALSKQRIANSEAELRIRRKYNLITQQEYESSLARLHGQLDNYETDYNNRLKKALQSMSSFGPLWLTLDKDARDMYNYVVSTEDALQQGTEQRNKQLKESYQGLKDSLKQYQSALAAGGDKDALNKNITWTKLMIKAIKLAAKLRGIDLTDTKKTGTGKSYDSISSLISLLKEMNSEYDKLSKSAYGFAKSNEKVVESFTPAFKEIFGFAGIDISQVDITSKRALADAMKLVIDTLDKKNLWGKFGSDGGKKARKEFVKAWSQEDVEADMEAQVRIREDFGKQMEQAFGDYELTRELDKLNIPKDAIKDIFPDFDTETLGELQDRMEAFYESQRDKEGNVLFDEDDFKEYKKWADKIDAEILKERKEKAKQYSKFLEKEYSERAKLEMQHAKDVAFVTANISDDKQRDNIVANINKKFQQDLNELNWKSFKESSFYVDMMDDLASLPKEYMQTMLNKIDEILKHPETLLPRALKEAINARQKILEAQMNLEPLDVMKSSIKTIRKAMDDVDGKTWKQTKEKINDQIKTTQEEIDKLEEEARKWDEVAAKMKVYEDAADDVETAKNKLSTATKELVDKQGIEATITQYQDEQNENQKLIEGFQKRQLEGEKLEPTEKDQLAALQTRNGFLGEQIAFLNEIIARERELQNIREEQHGSDAWARREEGYTSTDIGGWSQGLKDKSNKPKQRIQILKQYLQAFKNFDDSFAKFNAAINSTLNAVQGMGNAFYDMFDALGGETDALTEGWKEFGNTMITQITQTLTMIPLMVAAFAAAGIAINSALGIIGLIAEALQLLFTAIGAIAKLHDAHYEREIERQQKKIDELQRAYDRLEKQIEKTWDTVSYMQTYEQQVRNIREQIAATQAQLAAARQEKGADTTEGREKIRGYENALVDLYDQLEDNEQKMREVFGGIGEEGYRSAAEGFVEAWKSAFLETGDGLQGLQDHFDEFLQEWFVKQATMRIAGNMLQPMFEMLDKAVDPSSNGGVAVTMQELEALRDWAGTNFPIISDTLEDLAGMFGVGGEGSLSGLAAGIQGMTEEQANILEAYWNSVRMHTASIDINVAAIANALGVGAGIPESNPMLQQIRIVARNTANINSLLESVVKTGHSQGRSGIKVFLN